MDELINVCMTVWWLIDCVKGALPPSALLYSNSKSSNVSSQVVITIYSNAWNRLGSYLNLGLLHLETVAFGKSF